MGFGQPTLTALVKKVESNSPSVTSLDVSANASIRMKPPESLRVICNSLKNNVHLQAFIARECEITDAACVHIADMLEHNHTIEELDLSQNIITSAGAIIIAAGLAKNSGVRTLNLQRQHVKGFGEDCLVKYTAMFETNITLTKIMWAVESQQAWSIARLVGRNLEIQRRKQAGMDLEDLLPGGPRVEQKVAAETSDASAPEVTDRKDRAASLSTETDLPPEQAEGTN